MGRWFQKTTVGKTTLSNLWLRHWSVGETQPVITAAENDTGPSPAGHSSVSLGGRIIPLVLGEAWPLHFGMGWAHNTKATGAPQPAPCGTKEVGRIRRGDPAWGEQPLRGNQRRNYKKERKKERKGLHCKLLKRKNRKSSLANPCAIFSCPIIRVLSSWVLEPYITPQRLKKKKKKKKPRKKKQVTLPCQLSILVLQT